jgi:hypothetical protein
MWEDSVVQCLAQLDPKDAKYVQHLPGLGQDGLGTYLCSLVDSYSEQRAAKILSLVQPIALAVKSFSRVIGSMVQSNPAIAGLVWGSVQLLLEVSTPPLLLLSLLCLPRTSDAWVVGT